MTLLEAKMFINFIYFDTTMFKIWFLCFYVCQMINKYLILSNIGLFGGHIWIPGEILVNDP